MKKQTFCVKCRKYEYYNEIYMNIYEYYNEIYETKIVD